MPIACDLSAFPFNGSEILHTQSPTLAHHPLTVVTPAHSPVSESPTSQSLTSVLHVINGEHFSGAERVQQLLGQQLAPFGFNAHFACVKPGKFRACSGLPANQVHDTPMHGRFDLKAVTSVCKLARRLDVQLLHAHTPRSAMVAAMAAARLTLPWVYHVHSPTWRDSTRSIINRINGLVERFSVRRCDLLLTVSKSLRREMLRLGVKRSRLAVVPNGVPAIEPIEPERRRTQQDWTLGMVALMRPRKGVEVALQAMQQIKAQGKQNVVLKMIGGFETEDYEQQMKDLARKLQVDDVVEWTGFTTDIPSAVRELDAMILPSLFGEGMPMVVLEAISAGVPVVATRVEGTPEVIRDGLEGYLAQPQDATSLAVTLDRLMSDRTAWINMSRNALERHRGHFSDARMAERVAKAYGRILN